MKLSFLSILASGATASIVSIAVPATVAVEEPIEVRLVNNIDQSTTYQTSIIFGLGARSGDGSDMLGRPAGSVFLRDDGSVPPIGPFTRSMTINHYVFDGYGPMEIRAAVTGAYGVSGMLSTEVFSGNVTVGSAVGGDYVELRRV